MIKLSYIEERISLSRGYFSEALEAGGLIPQRNKPRKPPTYDTLIIAYFKVKNNT